MKKNNENVIEKSKEINNKKPVIINIFKKEINIDTKEGQINLATKGKNKRLKLQERDSK